jgi:hypothetical protein
VGEVIAKQMKKIANVGEVNARQQAKIFVHVSKFESGKKKNHNVRTGNVYTCRTSCYIRQETFSTKIQKYLTWFKLKNANNFLGF